MNAERLDQPTLAELARARARVWALLASLYASEPTAEVVEGLRSSNLTGLLQQFCEGRTLEGDGEPGEESLDDLIGDYTALFLGPGPHLSPHESVQRGEDSGRGLLWGQATVEVKAFMEAAGLTLSAETSLIPDHIALEFQFLARLAEAEAEAWEQKNAAQGHRRLEWQERFLREHVAAWVPDFARRVAEAAQTEFWRTTARSTARAVEQMAESTLQLVREIERMPHSVSATEG